MDFWAWLWGPHSDKEAAAAFALRAAMVSGVLHNRNVWVEVGGGREEPCVLRQRLHSQRSSFLTLVPGAAHGDYENLLWEAQSLGVETYL